MENMHNYHSLCNSRAGNEQRPRSFRSVTFPPFNLLKRFAFLNRSLFRLLWVLVAAVMVSGAIQCTNYSSDPYPPSTPVLLGLSPDGSTSSNIQAIQTYGNGHKIRVAAQNYEPGFQGYRLFQGSTEDAVRTADATTGIDCGTLLQTPVLGTVYTIEVRTDSIASESTALCVVPILLTSGNFVAIRAVYFRGLLDPESTGPSSNALQVP
ncbi:MAG TPA: hypothetical protein DEA96_08320 [Leptospiraceae bacterium]|nr:hypothetical protein [Spirochaetaceae bacterium]HBS04954.1 hypothetical protein [Leptospiraceae bacterium]